MKYIRATTTAAFVAASLIACDRDPVRENVDPQLTLSPDSVVVEVYKGSLLIVTVRNSSDASIEYASRDQRVATVDADGVIRGVTAGSTHVVAMLPDRPHVRDSVPVRVYSDSCSGERPDFGGMATAEDRKLFSYDVDAPLNAQKALQSTSNGVETSTISFTSPDGGLVTGLMWEPVTRSGLRPGIVLLHGHPGTAKDMTGDGQLYARHGAVVIAIDAPFSRRPGGPAGLTFLPLDRTEQIQLIKDLQRAVDVLRGRPNVDAGRIAFMGVSYGGALGALFVGIEQRLRAAALVVGHAGQVSHFTGPAGSRMIFGLPCAMRIEWIRAMAPIEPIRFIGHANVPLLLQNGQSDQFIPNYEAEELHAAAPEPKTVRWYPTAHNLNQQASWDRHDWLVQQIGIDPRGGS